MKTLVYSLLSLVFCLNSTAQDIAGIWHGFFEAPDGKSILFVFDLQQTEDGWQSKMAVPTFNVKDIQLSTTTYVAQVILMENPDLKIKYEGTWVDSLKLFQGIYTEGSTSLKLNLSAGIPEVKGPNRPQEPMQPYPYYSEDLKFPNPQAGIELGATFIKPKNLKTFPTVILISGSGRQDRNSSLMTHQPFLVLADYLCRQGIAVLRFDDRGFGESSGDFSTATTRDFASDVAAAVDYLNSRNDIDPAFIGLIGHSEGGIIAPLVALEKEEVKFIVSLAGTGVAGREISLAQSKKMRGIPVDDEAAFNANIDKAFDLALSNNSIDDKRKLLRDHYQSFLAPILIAQGFPEAQVIQGLNQEAEKLLSPWTQYFLAYNPSEVYAQLEIPVLALNGSKDIQVDPEVNLPALEVALSKGNHPQTKIKELAGLNHLFQECETGAIDEYAQIEQTFSPVALEEIAIWILGLN